MKAIKREGLEPTVRVIAAGLTEQESLLIETTLIWKLGKFTTNIAGGHFSGKFRPHNTLHHRIANFDFQNGVYYYNVGEGEHRSWDDYLKYGFISAGQGEQWRNAILGFQKSDVIVAYLKSNGFVGIGKILQPAKRIRDVRINGKPVLGLALECSNMGDNSNSVGLSEYVALVHWEKAVPREEAKWVSKSGLYTTTHVRASLYGQPKTVAFLEKSFDLDIKALIV